MVESVKIVALCIVSAVLYGILHDQITARICIEYFTVGHPIIIESNSPTLLALAWGVVATWWVGLILGIPLAIVSRLGSWPKYTATDLVKPIACLLLTMGFIALVTGITCYFAAKTGRISLDESLGADYSLAKQCAFLADLYAHTASYMAGFTGGIALCAWTVFRRWRNARTASTDTSIPAGDQV